MAQITENEDFLTEEIAELESSTWIRRAASPIIIFFTLLLGVFNILQAFEVHLGGKAIFMERYIALTTDNIAAVVLFLFGGFMLFLAYHLWLRKRAALLLLFAMFSTRAIIGILLGKNTSMATMYFMLSFILLLVAGEFNVSPDPASWKKFRVAFPILLTLYLVVATTGLYLLRGKLDVSANVPSLLYRTLLLAVGERGTANFHGWLILFADLLTLASVIGLFYLANLILRPRREDLCQPPEEHQRARELVEGYGSDSLAYFTIREDKNLFFHSDKIFLAYRCLDGIAVISGDPVGPRELVPTIIKEFQTYCYKRGWRLAIIGARDDYLPMYEQLDLKAICIGEEAVIPLDGFSLEGRQVKTLRHAVTKLTKKGVTMEFQFNAGIPGHLRHELAQLSADWREGVPETGFSMGLGRLMHSEDQNCLLAIAYDAESSPLGFLYMVPMYPHLGYSLDVARTAIGSTNGVNEFMIARTAIFLKEHGYRYMTLHLSGLSQFYREDRDEKGSALGRLITRIG
jgi:lysyl-tRNA synthetase class 2